MQCMLRLYYTVDNVMQSLVCKYKNGSLIVGNRPKSNGLFENTSTDPAKIIFAFYAALWAYDGW